MHQTSANSFSQACAGNKTWSLMATTNILSSFLQPQPRSPRSRAASMSTANESISSPLSVADGLLLSGIGTFLIQDAAGVIFETFCLSIYTVFFGLALYSIYRKPTKSATHLIMLAVVVYLYSSSLVLWAVNASGWFMYTRLTLTPSNTTMSLADRLTAMDNWPTPLAVPVEALFMFNMIVGDSVVIWRVWSIYGRSLRAIAIPALFLLASLGFTITDIICLTTSGYGRNSTVAGSGAICPNAELISWAVSVGTNASCTILIGIKAWKHRRLMRTLQMSSSSPRFSVDRVLSLLVESGSIYCLFLDQLTQVVLFLPESDTNYYAFYILGALGDQISGLYPTLIIVIVNFHQTIWDADPNSRINTSVRVGGNTGVAESS
ncbi:hypothetical protein HMN09_00132100 [Mycena chlorophos]|uniref:Uncharacterized protein n=1 Tax=Mycena chlorophos TaxID=658473 RepID=A0A8H6TPM7_MYCCL|nr:hypothetical protein HMN09_00132100 [Mycena chlorophos]